MSPDLLSDHFALDIQIPIAKRQLTYGRNRITLNTDKIDYFKEGIRKWYGEYNPCNLDQFYEDLVKIIVDLLSSNKTKKSGHVPRSKDKQIDKYYNDKELKQWSLLLRQAHRKWEGSMSDEARRTALRDCARLCSEMRKDIREQYWREAATKIGNCKNMREIWREVNKVRRRNTNSVVHPHPDKLANEMIEKWASAASVDSLPNEIKEALNE